MEMIFKDETKIKIYKQIQNNLCLLDRHSSDEHIINLINQIPENFFTQKDDLKMICALFSNYGRIKSHPYKQNTIKLFEKIMSPIKKYLQDESDFFWMIFGDVFYFKLWMYEEGLISIEHIIHTIQSRREPEATEYFLPEIIENAYEIYEKEISFQFKTAHSKKWINEFKELRRKHFKWMKESNDFNDPLYKEIEKDPLRLSIKTDDIENFQRILSNTNMSINSKIRESILENYLISPKEMKIVDYVIQYNASKIFKFLIINDVEMTDNLITGSFSNNNYEILHFIESKFPSTFGKYSLFGAISYWSNDLTEYALNNYNFEYLVKEGAKIEDKESLLMIIGQTFYRYNFDFLESILLPFLRKNSEFLNENIYDIIPNTIKDMTCFFFREFMKHPMIDINHHYEEDDGFTLLNYAVKKNNTKAVEILLENRNLDINNYGFKDFSTFQFGCISFANMKIIRMICNHPNFNVKMTDGRNRVTAFPLAVNKGNFYVVKYIMDTFTDFNTCSYIVLFFNCLANRNLFTLKILLDFYLNNIEKVECSRLTNQIRNAFHTSITYREEFINDFSEIFDEVDK
ncbi:hypothetical protein M9Y10_042713 [Tritrichomonas musculus]|uniref:DUF3447 domain-containing protein n=1 Tax=Tritrichomonas musculus TaxID=1915356 RepID=A0ABR2JYA6_9EUKA